MLSRSRSARRCSSPPPGSCSDKWPDASPPGSQPAVPRDPRLPGTTSQETPLRRRKDFYSIIDQHRVVNWIQREDIQNEMRNDIDDFLFDVVRDEMGVSLTVEKVDRIVDRILAIARVRMAS